MKRLLTAALSVLMAAALMIPVPAVSAAEGGAPQVSGWSVSTSHSGEVRGEGENQTDDQYITMTVTFDREIQIPDPAAAYNEFSVMLNDRIDITSTPSYTNGNDYPVYGTLARGNDGRSAVFTLHYGYAPFASHLTIVPKNAITRIAGTDGTPVIWKDVSLYVPNGVTFTTVQQTVGNEAAGTRASVTFDVNAPADVTRMMIHVLFLKNGLPVGETDAYGSNLTTHYHDFLHLTADRYADLFQGWFRSRFGNNYDISVNGSRITVTARAAENGAVLDMRVFAWPDDRDTGADKAKLKAALVAAGAVDRTKYTQASLSLMDNELQKARAVAASVYYSQEETDRAADALNTKIAALEKIGSFNDDSHFPFTDVAADRWSRSSIVYAYNRKLFSGTGRDTFSPALPMNRAMLVTVLYRLGGESAPDSVPFSDVKSGAYYYDAVGWASANGIVNGISDSSFAPETPLTREQMAAILYRYAQKKGYDTSASASLSGYADGSAVDSYAVKPMQWAVGSGLISGISDSELAPLGGAAREQVAAILMRFCQKYGI